VQGLGTNPSTVNQIVKSESVVRAVAAQVDVPPSRLRAGISSKAVAGAVARVGQTQLVEVSVRGPWRRQSAEAANLLADTVIERISGYPDAKIELLEGLLANQDEQLAAMQEAIDRYKSAVETDTTLSGTDRLVLVGLLDDAQQERGQLLQQKTDTELSLALARGVERGQVVTRATAAKVSARGRSSSMVVGAVIGLLAGIALALVWEPLRSRLGRSQAPA
jgi:capsular polysaccharide biosynthesis protein